ncbi:MAG: hypothetical protein ABIX12_09725, partial [Rubrivivax sp.]
AVAVRVVERDLDVRSVLWRGAIDSRLSDTQTNLRYRRLGGAAREALTADWITPAGLIAPEVKRELVRYRLNRIGPLGQPQRDFVARSILRKPAAKSVRKLRSRYAAITLSPSMHVSFELDAVRAVEIDARTSAGGPMRVDLMTRAKATGPVRVIDARWEGELPAGLYELRSAVAGTVDVRDAASGDPLVPDGLRPRFHVAGPSGALRYRLFAIAGQVPAIRLSLRAQMASSIASLTFADAKGVALTSRRVEVPWIASAFDRPAEALDRPAAEATRIDLQPPPAARELIVSADDAVLVTASTTLPARAGLPLDPRHRWFSFLPAIDPRSPLAQGVVIVQQPRRIGRSRATSVATPAANGAMAPAQQREAPRRPILRLRPERGQPEHDE